MFVEMLTESFLTLEDAPPPNRARHEVTLTIPIFIKKVIYIYDCEQVKPNVRGKLSMLIRARPPLPKDGSWHLRRHFYYDHGLMLFILVDSIPFKGLPNYTWPALDTFHDTLWILYLNVHDTLWTLYWRIHDMLWTLHIHDMLCIKLYIIDRKFPIEL